MRKVSFIKIDGKTHAITHAREYLREAGRFQHVWHRFVKGWCDKLNRWVTFCLGVVKSNVVAKWLKMTGQRKGCERRILLRRTLVLGLNVKHGAL